MFPTFDIASSALTTHQIWMNALADNIANINPVKPMSEPAYRYGLTFMVLISSGSRGKKSGAYNAAARIACRTFFLVHPAANRGAAKRV